MVVGEAEEDDEEKRTCGSRSSRCAIAEKLTTTTRPVSLILPAGSDARALESSRESCLQFTRRSFLSGLFFLHTGGKPVISTSERETKVQEARSARPTGRRDSQGGVQAGLFSTPWCSCRARERESRQTGRRERDSRDRTPNAGDESSRVAEGERALTD